MTWTRRRIAALMIAPLAGAAAAQDTGWEVTVSPYVWAPGISTSIETRFGTIEPEADISDVLSAADFVLMSIIEARRGRWGLIGDLVYADLSESQDAPLGGLFSRASADAEMWIASGYAAYRVHEDARMSADLLGGFRAVRADLDVALAPGALPGRRFDLGESWIDPVVGGRVQFALDDRWSAMAMADIGGSGGGSDRTWQAIATVGYQINDRWSVHGGWRQLSIEKDMDGRDVDIDLSGPVLGVKARF